MKCEVGKKYGFGLFLSKVLFLLVFLKHDFSFCIPRCS